jgi:DNA-binding NarL/FixJ family response regulator
MGMQYLECRAPKGASARVRFSCPLAGVPGASLVRRSFFRESVMAHPPPKKPPPSPPVDPLPSLPLDGDLWLAVANSLHLSPQLARAVEHLLRGLCNKQIADAMGISESTLETYFERIGARTGARGRTAIFRLILQLSHELRGPR